MLSTQDSRWDCRGRRAVRVANCSGARGDPGYQMLRQATQGDVDFITGDYLAEMNIAEHADTMAAGTNPGYDPQAYEGIEQSIDVIWQKRIKIILNAGALNPKGLAEEIASLLHSRGYGLKVAYVSGDNLLEEVRKHLETTAELLPHLDANNNQVQLHGHTTDLLDTHKKPVVAANAYLGARAIVKGLQHGADIIICGRVADASPVIGAAWYWHNWQDTSYDALAGALIAGHLVECSAYLTGANFSGFTEYDTELFLDLPYGIAEVAYDGTVVVTKHENTNGLVNADVVKCQFLYELQGDIYLNSDVKAYIQNISIENIGKNRVRISGVTGAPPPPSTKLAIIYHGGYEGQILLNATGYGTEKKWDLFKKQMTFALEKNGYLDKFQSLEFQVCGTPAANPSSQLQSTTYCRVFSQAEETDAILATFKGMQEFIMQHFSGQPILISYFHEYLDQETKGSPGFHLSFDKRTAMPRPYLVFYPAMYPQQSLNEVIHFLDCEGNESFTYSAGHPPQYEALETRNTYDTPNPVDLRCFGKTQTVRLGDIALGRSGDKGANINIGLFVRSAAHWDWFRSFLTREKMRQFLGQDDQGYCIERVEFPRIWAVHFVIYGILERGVSSCTKLDSLGKGFADYVRDKWIEVPVRFLSGTPRL